MSSEEFQLREDLAKILFNVDNNLSIAKKLVSTDNSSDFTRDELIALKKACIESYTTLGESMAYIRKINSNSKAQSSSIQTSK